MKKSYAILIALLLVLPMLTVAVPIRASTGTASLGVTNLTSTVTTANYNVSVKAGDSAGQNDVTGATGTFCIILDNVTFSGTQFNLYISKDGFSSISNSDLLYAATFNKADLLAPLHQVNITMVYPNAIMLNEPTTYWIGTLAGHLIVAGPIPFDITADYKFIKVWDGSSGAVAASTQTLTILPALSLSPTSGPGGETVTLTGVALDANTLYNITYDMSTKATAQITTDAKGTFAYTWNVIDLCNDFNDSVSVQIDLINNGTATWAASVSYFEFARYVSSYYSDYNGAYSGTYGNDSFEAGVTVLGYFSLEGLWFNPNAPLTFTIDNTLAWVPTAITMNSTGWFNATFTVPILSQADHNVTISDGGCSYVFWIYVVPTLIVTPDSGPIATNVNFTCYGFPANSAVYLYFYNYQGCGGYSSYTWYRIANTTTGANGQFNVTVPWTIPSLPGGTLWIDATTTFYGNHTTANVHGTGWIAETSFFITPAMWVTPSSLAQDGSLFTVTATGLIPSNAYTIDIDNQAFAMPNYFSYTYYDGNSYDTGTVQFADSVVWSDACGNMTIQLAAAGFRPGEHVVALYTSPSNAWASGGSMYDGYHVVYGFGNYSINAYALFSVSAVNDTEVNAIVTAINSTFATELLAMNATITSIQNDVATIQTNTGTIQAAVSALDAKVTTLTGNVATVSTNLGTLTGTVTSIQGDVATIKTDVGTIQATTTSIKSFLPVDLTPVWIAVILSLIAAIASIYGIIVIRSKIAA